MGESAETGRSRCYWCCSEGRSNTDTTLRAWPWLTRRQVPLVILAFLQIYSIEHVFNGNVPHYQMPYI